MVGNLVLFKSVLFDLFFVKVDEVGSFEVLRILLKLISFMGNKIMIYWFFFLGFVFIVIGGYYDISWFISYRWI